MRTFIIGVALFLLDHFHIPNATGDTMFIICLGLILAIVQDWFEILTFFKRGERS